MDSDYKLNLKCIWVYSKSQMKKKEYIFLTDTH